MLNENASGKRSGKYYPVVTLLQLMFLVIGSTMIPPVSGATTGVTTLCSTLPKSQDAGGIYPVSGGAFVEDWSTGNLFFCSGGTSTKIATAPSGGSGLGYWGMGGVKTTSDGLVLILTVKNPLLDSPPGLWVCKQATSAGCGSKSGFISLPSTFCSSEGTGGCFPRGTAVDKSLNLYYVDPGNGLIECTASSKYQSCTNLPTSSELSSGFPVGLFLKGSTFYISDESCVGTVWKGTRSSVAVIATVGEELDSIAVSTKNPTGTAHVYVGYTGRCTNTAAHIVDLTDGRSLPSPFSSPEEIPGLDSQLQFTRSVSGAAFMTTDSS